jgi:hypothetical protein
MIKKQAIWIAMFILSASTSAIAAPRVNNQPYQINVNVGGADAIGYGYNLSVSGCQ